MAEAFGIAASTIAVIQLTTKLVSLGYEYISVLKDAPKEIRQLVNELYSLSQILFNLQDFARNRTDIQHEILKMLDGQNGLLSECLMELKKIQLKIEPKIDQSSGSRMTIKSRLMWLMTEKDIIKHISQLERYKNSLSLILDRVQLSLVGTIDCSARDTNRIVHNLQAESSAQILLSESILGSIQGVNLTVSNIHTSGRTQAREREKARKRNDILMWLSTRLGDFDNKHPEISRERKANTGKWLLKEPAFQSFMRGDPRFLLLWGYGIPGAGKTFLSSMVIDHLIINASVRKYGVAYIYFDFADQDRQKPVSILANLLKQLLSQTNEIPRDLECLYDKLQPVNERPTLKDLQRTLFAVSKTFGRVFLIFDALDECNEYTQREDLLPLFHKLSKPGTGISIFLTSRPHPEDVRSSFQNTAQIELKARNEDIEIYIEEKIESNSRSRRLIGEKNSESRNQIISGLKECAKGMFLLVRFHIEYLCKQATLRQIMTELKKLKSSYSGVRPLDPTYDRVMDTINHQPENSVDLALKALAWLTRTRRTLSFKEFQQAISVEADQFELDESDHLINKTTILDICASLITIDEDTDTVRLAHYTVKEYLLRNKIPSDADLRIVMACTTYLSFNVFSSGKTFCYDWIDPSFPKRHQYPLLWYIEKNLKAHLRSCDEILTLPYLLKFLLKLSLNSDIPVLNIAFHLGHHTAMSYLLENGVRTSVSDFKGLTALHLAVIQKDDDAIQLLLEKGIDNSIQNANGETALHLSIIQESDNATKLLLEKGANYSIQNYSGETALHLAIGKERDHIVQLLLAKGIGHSIKNNSGETALHLALRREHNYAIQLLLEKGVDPSMRNSNGETALHLAITQLNDGAIQPLLEKGANHFIKKNSGETALHLAITTRNNYATRLLLKDGADPSIQNSKGQTALHLAIIQRDENLLRLLLEKGADPSTQDNEGQTALHLVIIQRDENLLRLLLENGADLSIQNSEGQTALHLAIIRRDENLSRLLLEKGADPSTQNNGQTALHLAIIHRDENLLRLLLEKGADPSTQNSGGQTALHLTIIHRDENLLRLLLEKGPDLLIQDSGPGDEIFLRKFLENSVNFSSIQNNRKTAYHQIVLENEFILELMSLLCKISPDLSIRDTNGDTLLHFAVATTTQDKEIVQLLLEKGADPTIRNIHGQTPLHRAAGLGKHLIVQKFVDKGVDINVQDNDGNSPLHIAVKKRGLRRLQVLNKAVIEILINSGADTGATDVHGFTPLDRAIGLDRLYIEEILEKRDMKRRRDDSDDSYQDSSPSNPARRVRLI